MYYFEEYWIVLLMPVSNPDERESFMKLLDVLNLEYQVCPNSDYIRIRRANP